MPKVQGYLLGWKPEAVFNTDARLLTMLTVAFMSHHSTHLYQLCSGLQPLSVDWREKLKANRKASSKGAASRSSPDPASSSPAAASAQADVTAADVSMAADGKPNLELLSKGLPDGWRAMWDKNSGDIYYGNLKSRVRVETARITFPFCTSLSALMV